MVLYEILCNKKFDDSDIPREASIGFIAEEELPQANVFIERMNARSMYSSENLYPSNYRIRPAVYASFSIPDEVVVLDTPEEGEPKTWLITRAEALKQFGDAKGVLYEHSYREVLQLIEGESKEQWFARREAAIARAKAFLKIQEDMRKTQAEQENTS